jgi:hypothetical protein
VGIGRYPKLKLYVFLAHQKPTHNSPIFIHPVGSNPSLTRSHGPWLSQSAGHHQLLPASSKLATSRGAACIPAPATRPPPATAHCQHHNLRRYEFPLQFDIPVAYPQVAPKIELPTLDGKTHKVDNLPTDYCDTVCLYACLLDFAEGC